MSGLRSREKGKRGERQAVALLLPLYPQAHRTAQTVQDRAACVPDVEGVPWWVEVKNHAQGDLRTLLLDARQQAEDDRARAGDKRPLLLVVKVGRGPWWVALELPRQHQPEWGDELRLYRIGSQSSPVLAATLASDFVKGQTPA